jgi:hypothetical protein
MTAPMDPSGPGTGGAISARVGNDDLGAPPAHLAGRDHTVRSGRVISPAGCAPSGRSPTFRSSWRPRSGKIAFCACRWRHGAGQFVRRKPRGATDTRPNSDCRFAQELVCNDLLLNLRSALKNAGKARIPPIAFHGMESRVSGAAQNLQRLARHPFGHFRRKIFDH